VTGGEGGGLRPVAEAQLLEDVAHVRLDRGLADHEPLGDLAVAEAIGHQREHLTHGLGAKRNGWLAHRALPGEADLDRERLTRAGLPVTDLEDEERLAVMEIDPERPADRSTQDLEAALDRALEHGFSAAWYSRFAVGPDERAHSSFRPFEDAWDRAFSGRPVVTLCPFVIGELDARAALERMDWLAPMHDSVLLPQRGGGYADR
jgi:hypothetical protein